MPEIKVDLYGRVFIQGDIVAITGLHIGGSPVALAIGALDNPVIRDSLSGRPYIPGSSLKGKMRSLWEKTTGAPQNFPIRRRRPRVYIHVCESGKEYSSCEVCRIYGVPGDKDFSYPTRLTVRDAFLSDASEKELRIRARTDLPYTEVKWEATIDRVTSAAVPRQMERVPAGAVFQDFEMVFSVYNARDLDLFPNVLEAMQLLDDDYLGGLGSRGSGKIRFQNLHLSCRKRNEYAKAVSWEGMPEDESVGVQDILDPERRAALVAWLKASIPIECYKSVAS